MKKRVGVAILGLGVVGGGTYKTLVDHREFYLKTQDVDIVVESVLDKDKEKLLKMGVPEECIAGSIAEVVANPAIDIVIETIGGVGIAKEFVMAALKEGKTVVTANKEMLSQIWINIIGNAIKFTPENGHIGITLRNEDGMAVATVSDDGIGMNDETLQRIFDKFYQGDTSHKSKGNGLGLAIASKIARLHSGYIKAESTENVGSVFTVYLPL